MHLNFYLYYILYYYSTNTIIKSNLTKLEITVLDITENNYMTSPVGEKMHQRKK